MLQLSHFKGREGKQREKGGYGKMLGGGIKMPVI